MQQSLSKLSIKNISVPIYIGIHSWEKKFQQIVKISLQLFLRVNNHCQLSDTVDYDRLCADLKSYENEQFDLIENFSGHLCEHLLDKYPVILGLKLKVKKQVCLSGRPSEVSFSTKKWR